MFASWMPRPGWGEGFRLAAGLASRQLLVAGPDPAALRDGARTGEILELMGKPDVRLVVNRVNPRLYRAMGLTVDDVMDMVGYPLLGLVPEDKNVPPGRHGGQAPDRFRPGRGCRRLPPDGPPPAGPAGSPVQRIPLAGIGFAISGYRKK